MVGAGAHVKVLSAGAIEPGLADAARDFGRQSGCEVVITWATTPTIRQLISAQCDADVLVVPPQAIDDFAASGKVVGNERVYVGRVGVGVVIRCDAPAPDISTTQSLRQALLDAESVIFNRASSGLYIEQLLARMGIAERIESKCVRHDNGPAMLERLLGGNGREFGFGAIVEILMYRERGLRLVGPLPEDIQHRTAYMAVPVAATADGQGARAFLRYLDSPPARRIFASHGIE